MRQLSSWSLQSRGWQHRGVADRRLACMPRWGIQPRLPARGPCPTAVFAVVHQLRVSFEPAQPRRDTETPSWTSLSHGRSPLGAGHPQNRPRLMRWREAPGQGQVASGSRLVIAHARLAQPQAPGRARAGRDRATWLLERRNKPQRPRLSRQPGSLSTPSQTLQRSWRSWSYSARGGFQPHGRRRSHSRSRSRSRAVPGAPTRLCCGAHRPWTRWRLLSHASLAPPPPPDVGPRVGEPAEA